VKDLSASALIGQRLGDFEILEEIGRGGMGVVFRARQASLDRMVALKILSGHFGTSAQAVARFQREAQATAKLHHPHILPVYAQGVENGTYYYAMELVSGRSLHDIIGEVRSKSYADPNATTQRTPVQDMGLAETALLERSDSGEVKPAAPVVTAAETQESARPDRFERFTDAYFDEICRQIRDVADALEFAHRNGVVHRDIKPHNLLIGDRGKLCLSDFGLARVLEQPGMTMTGELVGSPLYMSPEQTAGRGDPIGPSTDIYALGATLYEWLTLSPPHPGQTREEVITRILTQDVIAARQRNPRVPVDLETIALKALEKDPHRRYQTAGEMRDDLQRFLDRTGIRARRAGVLEQAWRWTRRKRVAATAGVAAVLVTILIVALMREHRETLQAQDAVTAKHDVAEALATENARLKQREEELSRTIQQRLELGGQFAKEVSGLFPSKKEDYAPIEDGQRLGALFLTDLRAREVARLRDAGAAADQEYLAALTEEQSAAEALARVDQLLAVRPDTTDARVLRAWILCQLGRVAEMRKEAGQLVAANAGAVGHVVNAAALLLAGEPSVAHAALENGEGGAGAEALDVLRGLIAVALGQSEVAEVAFGRALILNPKNVLALLKRAESSFAEKHYEHAIVDLTSVIELEPRNAEAIERRGDCQVKLGKFDEAISDFEAAIDISNKKSLYLMKIVPAMVSRDAKQQESKESQDPSSHGVVPPLPAPGDPSGVTDWLKHYMERRKSEGESRVRMSVTDLLGQ
jgi:serine/threonine protein kinase/Flp pilus assembly protein TadD